MAYPDDEKNGANGFLKTNLANPNLGNTVTTDPTQTDPGSVINYAPPTSPIGAAQSREAQIAALLPALPESLKSLGFPQSKDASGIVVVPNTAANQRDADFERLGTGLPSEVHQTYQDHRKALADADKYLAVSGHLHSMRTEIESKLDSADFLKDFSKLDHTSPTYEADSAKLFAKYPKASGSAVQDAVTALHGARSTYLQATAPGGADEFGENTPERNAYVSRYQQTKNPQAARAHALNTQKGEEMIRANAEKGIIDPNEMFAWDEKKQDYVHPENFNPDGSVNYHAVALQAATNAASGDSAKVRLQTNKDAVAAAEKFLQIHKEEPKPSDPNYKDWHAANSILIRSMRGNDRTSGSSLDVTHEPAPKPTPTGTPPPIKAASAYTRF